MQKSRIFMITGALLLLTLFVLPLWNITLEAPQYPTALGMNIHINKLADENPNDLQNINLMNHYVGMKNIPDHLKEFEFFPYIVIFMVILGVFLGFKANYKWFLAWFLLMVVLGILGMYDFYLWEYDYGHNLNEHAAIKFTNSDGTPMAYQPPLIGTKTILNFTAHSYPKIGAIFMFLGMLLSLLAYYFGKKESVNKQL
jgi:copper chaperone NosL